MDDMIDTLYDLLDEAGYDEWDIEDDVTLICPHGHPIEWDGKCPEGCDSPLKKMGLI